MYLALIASLLGAATPATPAAQQDDPPVKIWLNQDSYFLRGDKARVNVRVAEDGYVVVLRADTDGRVRVLFPLDPSDDAFVRGDHKIEIRGRGDREAFAVDDREGSGVVLAARSVAPFKFDEFVRGDHWDYRVLSARDAGDDKEQALLDMVQRMTPDQHFDYDAIVYTVQSQRAYYDGSYYYPTVGLHIGYGWPYRYGYGYSSCFDPFFYDPFFCSAYDPFFFGYSPYYYRPYYYRPYVFAPYYGGGFVYRRSRSYGGGLFIDRARPGFTGGALTFKDRSSAAPTVLGVGPRLRVPQGTLLDRAAPARTVPVATPVRARDITGERARDIPIRERGAERRQPEARPADRGERRDNGRGADRSSPPPRREPSSSGGGWSGRSSGGGGGGGGARPSGGSSGSSGWSQPSNGGGRRKP